MLLVGLSWRVSEAEYLVLRYIDSGTWNNVRAFLEELSSKVSSLVGNHQSAITHFF